MSERFKRGELNEQLSFGLFDLESMIRPESFARVIAAFFAGATAESLPFKTSVPLKRGNKPYHPLDLMKLYLYGYRKGIRSSRKLEEQCYINLEVIWLLDGLKPDDKTISNFRKDNADAFEKCFCLFLEFCDQSGLLGKRVVGIDGTKMRAWNSRKHFLTEATQEEKIKYYKKEIQEYMDALEQEETAEEERERKHKELERMQLRVEELEQELCELKETGAHGTEDRDCRYMKMNNNGRNPGYNCQTAVDEKHHLVVGTYVTNESTDKKELYRMAREAKERLGVEELKVLADKGYFTGEELHQCKEENIHAIVSVPERRNKGTYGKENFQYHEEKDYYTCPSGRILSRHGKKTARYYNSKACEKCSQREQCTKGKKKIIESAEYEADLREAKSTYQEQKEEYKKRQNLCEHPFGTVKRGLGYDYYLTKGLKKVNTENVIHFLTYNVIRVVNIYVDQEKFPELLKELREKMKRIWDSLHLFMRINHKRSNYSTTLDNWQKIRTLYCAV